MHLGSSYISLLPLCLFGFSLVVLNEAFASPEGKPRIHPKIEDYSFVNINSSDIVYQLSKLSNASTNHIYFHLQCFDKNFTIHLVPYQSHLFGTTVVSVAHQNGSQNSAPLDKSNVYEGDVFGREVDSSVFMFVSATGLLEGHIFLSDEGYILEPFHNFGGLLSPFSESFNHVCHRFSDHDITDWSPKSCATETNTYSDTLRNDSTKNPQRWDSIAEAMFYFSDHPNHGMYMNPHRRARRSFDSKKPSCGVQVVADHLFYQAVGQSDMTTTQNKLMLIMASVDQIFSTTNFNGILGVHVHVAEIVIWTSVATPGNLVANSGTTQSSTVLTDFSSKSHAQYCLSHLFTYRDFNGGVLGLAFIGGRNSNEGICGTTLSDGSSLNTGLTTMLNFGEQVSLLVGTLTTAHELGHNFGALHDPPTQSPCSPGPPGGAYLMFASAQSGKLPNNNKFSQCSIDEIYDVLMSSRTQCFSVPTTVCGNGIREYGEDCDCGSTDEQCARVDPCCDRLTCKVKAGLQCSLQSSVCCNSNCTFSSPAKVCNPSSDCTQQSTCTGLNGNCPDPLFKTGVCAKGAAVCSNGTCSGSICPNYGLTACNCNSSLTECSICCQNNQTGLCQPLSLFPINHTSIYLPPNWRCSQGLCDGSGNCVSSSDTQTDDPISRFFRVYWWAIAIGVGALLILSITFYLICSKRTETKIARKRAILNAQRSRSIPVPQPVYYASYEHFPREPLPAYNPYH